MKYRYLLFSGLLLAGMQVNAQELYVSSDPASNIAAHSLSIRLTNKFFRMEQERVTGMRFAPELMWGLNKKLMLRVTGYASNQMQASIRPEGASVYAKYRFLSQDELHSHFRMAAYVKGAVIDNPYVPAAINGHSPAGYKNEDIDLEGMSSGVAGGVIATQLIHKLALSGTVGYNRFLNNTRHNLPDELSRNAVNYSLSAGYLLLPFKYKSYDQTNLNLYVEFLGKANTDRIGRGHYVDIAPAIQFIFNSTTRLDVSYRTQLAGDMQRNIFNTFLVRLEHNIFNLKK
ncbi:hypothetical protein KTO58_01795 [Chitinophaga pendula]|uniref:hypothetical protein n=1 Tax=Chitinophaga TaxID=79328 RepID=UPI000BAEB888|nr:MULTISPECIES: hypothetical protein [Chitinophaga]ASZ14408.1 hypothetical protein CK934_27430 [Chitinophaga sp. MD30]UCJ07938.1 hypothetical protein KTO58_01795 [Chitinophaga pendula]